MSETPIEWTDRVWNPVRGCALVSPGCSNCYAMKTAHRFAGEGMPYEGLTREREKGGPVWTGDARFIRAKLAEPLRWRKPRKIFVNSMSDLFHEDVTFEQIAAVFGVMAAAPQHTYQVLTKRPERAVKFFNHWMRGGWPIKDSLVCARHWLVDDPKADGVVGKVLHDLSEDARPGWPLPNVWMGVSVEDQARADERIPLLLQMPAAVRFLSVEPLIGPIDLTDLVDPSVSPGEHRYDALSCDVDAEDDGDWNGATIDWVIVGGESGPGARPCDIAWIASIRDQCAAAGVPCFVKQAGSQAYDSRRGFPMRPDLVDRKGGWLDELPGGAAAWPREFPRIGGAA